MFGIKKDPLVGAIFLIPQLDGKFTVAQVLDMMMPNWASCALFAVRVPDPSTPTKPLKLSAKGLLSSICIHRAHLDAKAWKIVDHRRPLLPQRKWPNEQYRRKGWIGAKSYDGAIVEDFLNAFYGLEPWDQYKDPHYFDKLLADPKIKPKNLIYKNHD